MRNLGLVITLILFPLNLWGKPCPKLVGTMDQLEIEVELLHKKHPSNENFKETTADILIKNWDALIKANGKTSVDQIELVGLDAEHDPYAFHFLVTQNPTDNVYTGKLQIINESYRSFQLQLECIR